MKYVMTMSLLLWAGICFCQRIRLEHQEGEKRVEVTVDGKPFTSYYYPGPDVIKKPVLYPVYSPGGNLVTRGWPLDPRPGERVDHPHHIGIWFNYEDINGNDFWNNSIQVSRSARRFGTIKNTRIEKISGGKGKGTLVAGSDWVDNDGVKLLEDITRVTFLAVKNDYIIDYEITLKAVRDLSFRDVKDGMFAFRLARELELKYDRPETLTGPDGKPISEKTLDNSTVTGSYYNRDGHRDDEVWGKPSPWCAMTGRIGEEDITIAILDHPSNFGYPGYFHARGYGLFSLNSVARKAFVKEAEPYQFKLKEGEKAVFRYRVVVSSGKLAPNTLDELQQQFGKVR